MDLQEEHRKQQEPLRESFEEQERKKFQQQIDQLRISSESRCTHSPLNTQRERQKLGTPMENNDTTPESQLSRFTSFSHPNQSDPPNNPYTYTLDIYECVHLFTYLFTRKDLPNGEEHEPFIY